MAVNMWKKMRFFDHPFASDGWHSLKLILNNLFITLKWLLTCFEFICSFLLSLCANERLYYRRYIGTGMAGHAQARKKKWEKLFSSSTQNGPIRKVNMFKPPNSNILKILPSTGCLQPRLSHFFTQKKSKSENFFSSIQNGPIRKVNMFKPPNSNILKIFSFNGCLHIVSSPPWM